MSINPKNYAVLLKDNNGNLISHIQNVISDLSWDWNRIGGCGACSFKADLAFDGALTDYFAEDSEINIYAPDVSGTSCLWYSGYIDKVKLNATGIDERVDVSCLGFVNQLKRAAIRNKTYTGIESKNIVKDMVEVYGTGITDIISSASNYDLTDFTCDNIYFNEDLAACVKKIADIVGKREWGVDADKNFFFKARNDAITKYYFITEDFVSWQPSRDYNPIITGIYIQGGEGYEGSFAITNRLSVKEKIIQNSSIISQSVGQQYARMYLKENGIVRKSYIARLVRKNNRIESTLPMGRASVNIKKGIKSLYDVTANKYDSGLKYDGGEETYQIENIKYKLTDDGIEQTITFNARPPSLADEFDKLEFMLTNQGNI